MERLIKDLSMYGMKCLSINHVLITDSCLGLSTHPIEYSLKPPLCPCFISCILKSHLSDSNYICQTRIIFLIAMM